MNIEKKIESLVMLGADLKEKVSNYQSYPEFYSILNKAKAQNPWFTLESITESILGICNFLDEENLRQWIGNYTFPVNRPQLNIGIVMAGNIPLVGFHDFLCVLVSGHKAIVKLSSKDKLLLKYIAQLLTNINNQFADFIYFEDAHLKQFDAVIATGSDNSSRYFEYYFSKYPHIIRKNRNSVAFLTGNETDFEIERLGKDIFQYFGLGCRNVSKIYIPRHFSIEKLMLPLEKYKDVIFHNKYCNNYEYNKSIYLINRVKHFDNGFLLLKEDTSLASPLAVIHYQMYDNEQEVISDVYENNDKIQCIVSSQNIFFKQSVLFGNAQYPALWDYADDIDTLKFLCTL
jgi:hypothetical protein